MPKATPQDCIFCHIVAGTAPAHQIWSDDKHLAFLSIFPNMQGVTIVMPKAHHSSYAFAQEDRVLTELMVAAKKVARILDGYFDDVGRCGLVFEGFGVDHLHAKLYPLHGTGNLEAWRRLESSDNKAFFEVYPGYISSNDSHRADDDELASLAAKIRQSHSRAEK